MHGAMRLCSPDVLAQVDAETCFDMYAGLASRTPQGSNRAGAEHASHGRLVDDQEHPATSCWAAACGISTSFQALRASASGDSRQQRASGDCRLHRQGDCRLHRQGTG